MSPWLIGLACIVIMAMGAAVLVIGALMMSSWFDQTTGQDEEGQ